MKSTSLHQSEKKLMKKSHDIEINQIRLVAACKKLLVAEVEIKNTIDQVNVVTAGKENVADVPIAVKVIIQLVMRVVARVLAVVRVPAVARVKVVAPAILEAAIAPLLHQGEVEITKKLDPIVEVARNPLLLIPQIAC